MLEALGLASLIDLCLAVLQSLHSPIHDLSLACKFISKRGQIQGREMEDVWKFRWIVLLQDSYNAGWNFLDEVLSMVTGEIVVLYYKNSGRRGWRCAADFDRVSPRVNWLQVLANASLREFMLLIQLNAGGRKVFVSMRSSIDVCESGDKRAINRHHFCWALLIRPERDTVSSTERRVSTFRLLSP